MKKKQKTKNVIEAVLKQMDDDKRRIQANFDKINKERPINIIPNFNYNSGVTLEQLRKFFVEGEVESPEVAQKIDDFFNLNNDTNVKYLAEVFSRLAEAAEMI